MFLSLIPLMCWVIIRYVSWQVYGILGLVSASQTQISLCHNLLLGCQIILTFCTENDSITVVLGQLFTMIECACSVAVQSFSLKFSSQILFVQYTNFERIFWRAHETLVKQPLDAFPVLVRKEGAAVDCADLQCFLVDNSCNVCIRVADRLFEWFGRRCYFKTYAL